MGPQHALVALLSLVGAANAQYFSSSAFWTYTSRYAALVSQSPYTRTNGVVSTYTVTDRRRTVKPTVTPTATPTSTTTYYSTYADLEIVYQYYGLGAVAESDLVPETNYDATTTSLSVSSTISFFMPVTMTAPASCPTQFTHTTSASVYVPSQVWDQLKPSSTVNAGTTTRAYYAYNVQTWYLSAGAAPFTSTSDVYYRYYIASCSTPPAARLSGYRTTTSDSAYPTDGNYNSGNDDNNNYSSQYCSRYSYYCDSSFKSWIIIVATVIPGLFLLGFLESWFWFRRLMMGKSAMRFGTVCWVLISLLVLCFTRMQDARSKDDQKLLQEKWKTMGSGAAFKAWWKWGFRHGYPVEHLGQFSKTTVGVVPANQPLYPAMQQTQPGFMPGPPPPGAPGQVYYYGPPPPGWIPTPNGQGFMPPQGYYPPPQQTGFYAGNLSKDGPTVSTSPVPQHPAAPQHPAMAPQHPISPIGTPSPPPQVPQPVHHAPSPPPPGPVPAPPAPQANVSEAPAHGVTKPQPPLPKNDPNDRSLYE